MKPIKTAIFGTGFMGRVHLEAVRRVECVEAAAIAGRNAEATRRLGSAYGVPLITTDYREVLRDPTIDAVHICTPNAQHFSMAKDALLGGQARALRKAAGHYRGRRARNSSRSQPSRDCATALATTCATTRWCSRCARCARPAIWARFSSCRARIRRTGCSTTPIGTGASKPKPAALRAAWPISARTGSIWRSTSPDCA